MVPTIRVGVIGYGHLGKFLTDKILEHPQLELAFVWNRSLEALADQLDEKYILCDLNDFKERNAGLIIEVAHPDISLKFGEEILKNADYMIGSPCALANKELEDKLRNAATHHGLYVPSGAFWGAEDIEKLADVGSLKHLKITMTKHMESIRWLGDEFPNSHTERTILYNGPVRGVCPLAPNNVNTMAAGAIAAHTLGFDKVEGCLIADPNVGPFHVVEVDVYGPGEIGNGFHVHTCRRNPAKPGGATGSATFNSFFNSLLRAHGKGSGVHLC